MPRLCRSLLALLVGSSAVAFPRQSIASAAKPASGPAASVGRVLTVAQFELALAEIHNKSDRDAARELSRMQLSERASSARAASWKEVLPGQNSRLALLLLVDASEFLPLPADEVLANPAPDLTEQQNMIALTLDYLSTTVSKLPNFSATRSTTRFEDTQEDPDRPGVEVPSGLPLHFAGESTAMVVYRNGNEEISPVAGKGGRSNLQEKGLVTSGTFGSILSTVMVDASQSEIAFGHWERGAQGPEAVFHYSVPMEKSHYRVVYRSAAGMDRSHDLDRPTSYHGELAINPANGTILRLTLEADLGREMAMMRSDIMVEYGPVEIGGMTYICPVWSVSVSTGRAVIVTEKKDRKTVAVGPEITRLNDVVFGEYHVFRTEMKVLPGDSSPEEK